MQLAREQDSGLVAVIVYEGLSLFEYGCAVEVFGLPRPELGGGWYSFATLARSRMPLRGAGGIQVVADGDFDLLETARTIEGPAI